MNGYSILLIAILFHIAQQVQLSYKCSHVFNKDAFFSLEKMKDAVQDYRLHIPQTPEQDKTKPGIVIEPYSLELFYNFCIFSQKCSQDSLNSYSVLKYNNGKDQCLRLTGDSVYSNITMKLIDDNKPQKGVRIIYPKGDIYHTLDYQAPANIPASQNVTDLDGDGKVDEFFNFEVEIECDKDETQHFLYKNYTHTNNQFIIKGKSRHACPTLLLSALWKDLSKNNWVFGIGFWIIGCFFCFLGNRFKIVTNYLTGFFSACGFLIVLMGEFVIEHDTDYKIVIISVIIAVLFGLLFGFMTHKLKFLAIFILGCLFGLMFALVIHNTILFRIKYKSMIYIALLVIGVGCGIAGLFLRSYITIVSTSFCGAYMIVRPFGWFIGYFPNEFTLVKELKYDIVDSIPSVYYLYIMLIILFTGIGMKVQYDLYGSLKDREEEEQNDELRESDLENSLIEMEVVRDKSESIKPNKSLLKKNTSEISNKKNGEAKGESSFVKSKLGKADFKKKSMKKDSSEISDSSIRSSELNDIDSLELEDLDDEDLSQLSSESEEEVKPKKNAKNIKKK